MNFYNVSLPAWHVVDARGQVVGRLASRVASILRGKHKPTYNPQELCGDNVVVLNASDVVLTGDKREKKTYYWHTGYPGGLRQRTAAEQFDRKPEEVLRRAVWGMLPNNRLRKKQARMLRIFPGEEHPHGPQILGKDPLQL